MTHSSDNRQESTDSAIATLSQVPSQDSRDVAFWANFSEYSRIDDSGLIEATIDWPSQNSRVARFCFCNEQQAPDDSDLVQGVFSRDRGEKRQHIASFELRRVVLQEPSKKLFIQLPSDAKLSSVSMISGRWCASLQADLHTVKELANGNYFPDKGGTLLKLDVSGIPGACGMILEQAKPNFLFEFGKSDVRAPRIYPHLERTKRFSKTVEKVSLSQADLKPGYRYAFRLIALDSTGNYLGYYSDTVSIDLRKEFF